MSVERAHPGRAPGAAVRAVLLAVTVGILLSGPLTPGAAADTYPRQPGIDVLHYVFALELYDDTDRIDGVAEVELRARRDGVAEVVLDLVDPVAAGGPGGMTVSEVRILASGADDAPDLARPSRRAPAARADMAALAGVLGDQALRRIARMRLGPSPTAGARHHDHLHPLATVPDEKAGLGIPVQFVHEAGRLRIPLPRDTRSGEVWRIAVHYAGEPVDGLVIGENMHGDRSFFSNNWPNRARHWLPTVDHPHDKATSEMVVTAPDRYQVVSNGLLVEETDLAGGRRRTHWRQSVPIATWLYVLGVARFAVEHHGTWRGGDFRDVPLQTWVYPQDRETGFEVFDDPTPAVLDFYDARIGPYAYEKLANIQAHSLGGGMEAASAIFYGEESATGARPVRWRNVIIHEIAHQWWGNAVTESDWDDVWLSEGFATYFTLLFREHAYGRDDFVEGLLESRERVLAFDAEHPDYRIVHDELEDMSRVTTGQTYQKGAWVLHMLRGLLGDADFWQGVAGYYARYQNANATTDDFRREMEEASGRQLGWFFEQWLTRGSHPVVSGTWGIVDGAVELRLRQEQPGEPFRLPMTVGLRTASGEERREPVVLEGARGTFRLAVDGEVAEVFLDPDHWVLMRAEVRRR